MSVRMAFKKYDFILSIPEEYYRMYQNQIMYYYHILPSTLHSTVCSTKPRLSWPMFCSVSYCSLLMLGAIVLFGTISEASPLPFDRNAYPSIDLRLFDWPIAEHRQSMGREQYIPLDCYTQLDTSFVDGTRLYRLNSTHQLQHRACMLRIPTRTRITVERMHTRPESYVTVMAGSSQLFMPVWTGRIQKDQPDMYGPWHVPCLQAYLVFNAKGTAGSGLQWVEFRLEPETEQDRQAENPADCHSEGVVNRAELEFMGGETTETEEEK